MSADLIELAGWGFSAWVIGYCMGLFILAFRKFTDKI